jgi:hypothetical protein
MEIFPMRFAFCLFATLIATAPIMAQNNQFRAGAFAMNINPEEYPISVNGNMRDGQATMASDPLHARCIVLDDGRTKLAIVVCDSCMIPREIFDAAKKAASAKTGIPTMNMLCSATHTHTAPTSAGVFQSDPVRSYQIFLEKKIAQGIIEAHNRLQPAKIGFTSEDNDKCLFNRRWLIKDGSFNTDPFGNTTDRVIMNPGYRNPRVDRQAGPVDPQVSIVSIVSKENKPLALLANYGLHYVGGAPALSADYFGAYADRMKELLNADKSFVAIMSNGTSGDVNNVDFANAAPGKREPYEQIRFVANSVAQTTLKALEKIKYQDHASLAAWQREIDLGVRKPGSKELDRAKDILAKAKSPVLQTSQEIYSRESVLLADYPEKVPVILQALRIGDIGICAIPCEVFTEIGLELKKKSPIKHTFTIELANGYNGYLPTPKQHELGGYETWRARSSYLEASASDKIIPVLLDCLNKVSK